MGFNGGYIIVDMKNIDIVDYDETEISHEWGLSIYNAIKVNKPVILNNLVIDNYKYNGYISNWITRGNTNSFRIFVGANDGDSDSDNVIDLKFELDDKGNPHNFTLSYTGI